MVQESITALVNQVLGDSYLDVHVDSYIFEEHIDNHSCEVRFTVTGLFGDSPRDVKGQGVGFVDAVFHAFRDALAEEYPSLKSILFAGFEVQGDFNTRQEQAGSDAVGRVVLSVENSRGRVFRFDHTSRSMTGSAVIATLQATEYFVNTERAFISLHRALADAKSRNRPDLAERYAMQISEILENTSYSEVIERLNNEN